MFLYFVLSIIIISMAILIITFIRGRSIWDKLLVFSLLSSKVIMFIIVISFINNTIYFIDIVIIYMLLGFIGLTFTALFLKKNKK